MTPINLASLIAEIDSLRIDLGYTRFNQLAIWWDGGPPKDADEGALWRLLERLCVLWVDRHE